MSPPTVSFDVYSALVDSRRGGTRAFTEVVDAHSWDVDPAVLYDAWDAANKQAHASSGPHFLPFRELATGAMRTTLGDLELNGDPTAITADVLASMRHWPHWPDTPDALASVGADQPVALLTNIDDDLLAVTDVGAAIATRVTSQQARAYKPHRAFYDHARHVLGEDVVHVAASARDVRGSLEAGMRVVRIARPGHRVDPDGPQPTVEIDDLRELPAVLAQV